MENVNIPTPNPFITQWLIGAECRAMVLESCELYEALYREVVAKRTGRLAASTHVSTGVEDGRWAGHMTVTAPYAASEEFGAGDHPASTHRHHQDAARDLNTILDAMGKL